MIGALVNALAGRSLDTGLAGGGLKFNFLPRLFQRVDTDGDNMARTSNFANVATVTRASTKTDAGGWDFTSGGTVGTLTEYASGVAAIHSTAGLLVEEGTTNANRNPRCEGAVAGTPGTPPTNWAIGTGGATSSIVGSGVEDGWPYVDIRWSGTSTSDPVVVFDSSTNASASNGETWAGSVGVKLVAGSLSNIDQMYLAFDMYDSGASLLARRGSSALTSPDANHRRVYFTYTLDEAATASVQQRLFLQTTGSVSIDVTLRIYAPQLEEKAYPTSPVVPVVSSPAASTRARDDVDVPSGAWEKAGSGFSCYAEMTTLGNSGGALVSLGPDNNNRATVQTNGLVFANSSGTTIFNSGYGGSISAGSSIKVAMRLADADSAASRNSVAQITSSSGFATQYGNGFITSRTPSGGAAIVQGAYLKDLRYWPSSLTNAELEALVGN